MLEQYEIILKHNRKKDPEGEFEELHEPLHVKFIYDPELENRNFVLDMYFRQLSIYDSGVDKRLI